MKTLWRIGVQAHNVPRVAKRFDLKKFATDFQCAEIRFVSEFHRGKI